MVTIITHGMDKIWAISTLDKHRWIENAVDEGDAASSAAEGGDEARAVDYSSMFASAIKAIKPIERGQEVLMNYGARYQYPSHYGPALL